LPWKADIEHETGRSVGSPRSEEVADRSKEVDGKADGTQQTAKRLADLRVIIDDNDGCWRLGQSSELPR
jgi:hypothetical protein